MTEIERLTKELHDLEALLDLAIDNECGDIANFYAHEVNRIADERRALLVKMFSQKG